MISVIVSVDRGRRIRVYPAGGLDLEARVEGMGWVLDNDADVPDRIIAGHLKEAAEALHRVASKLQPATKE